MKIGQDQPILESSGARVLYGYWQQARGVREMPAHADIDAAQIRAVLPHVQLYDVLGGGRRFFTRVAGSAALAAYGYDPTGQFVDEAPAGTGRRRVMAVLREVVRTGAPAAGQREIGTGDGQAQSYEDIMLPLSGDGHEVNMVLHGSFTLAESPPGPSRPAPA